VKPPAPIVVVSNQKGGVGKTTTTVNLAAYAGLAGLRVLVVDNDPQANATSNLLSLAPADSAGARATICENSVYSGAEPRPTTAEGVSIIPAGADLADQERRLATAVGGSLALRTRLAPMRVHFDLILIDCPPNLTCLPTNALLAATHLVVPLQCEYFALEGLSQLLAHVDGLRQDHELQLELCGILLTMAAPGSSLAHGVAAEVRRHFGPAVFDAMIPRDETAAAAPSRARALVDHDPMSPAALAYLAASRELLARLALLPSLPSLPSLPHAPPLAVAPITRSDTP
jgi:chromosome partitioning protein